MEVATHISRNCGRTVRLLACLTGIWLAGVPLSARAEVVRVATGSAAGVYHSIVSDAASIASAGNLVVEPIVTRGSAENFDLLVRGEVEAAIIQADVAHELFRSAAAAGHAPALPLAAQVLFAEYLHVLVRYPLTLEGLRDVASTRVWLGQRESGSRYSAERLLETLGLPASRYQLVATETRAGSRSDVADLTLRNRFAANVVDVAFVVSAVPNSEIRDLLDESRATLLSLDPDAVRRLSLELRDAYTVPVQSIDSLPADYGPRAEGIRAVVIPAMLFVAPDLPDATAGALVQGLRRAIQRSGTDADFPVSLDPQDVLRQFPQHVVAQSQPTQFYFWERMNTVVAVLTLVIGGLLVWRKRNELFRYFSVHQYHLSAGIFLFISMGCILGAYLVEHRFNPYFSGLLESGWSIAVYMVSGLEDRNPVTFAGKLFAVVAMLSGPLVFALLTGVFASSLVVRNLQKVKIKTMENHIVILNWRGDQVFRIIRDLHCGASDALDAGVVVMSNYSEYRPELIQKEIDGMADKSHLSNVNFVFGDPCDALALRNIKIGRAEVVVILASGNGRYSADELSIQILVAIKNVLAEGESPRIVVELQKESVVPVVKEIAARFPGTVDVVAGAELNTRMLSSAAISGGIVGVYTELLSPSLDTNELYTVTIPEQAAGKTFEDYALMVRKHSCSSTNPTIAIGIRRRVGRAWALRLNPKAEDPMSTLQAGDELVVVAWSQPIRLTV